MKRLTAAACAVCLAVLAVCSAVFGVWIRRGNNDLIRVGFLYEEDESTPYTYNFMQAQYDLEDYYGERIRILSYSNVLGEEIREPLQELARKGCSIIFTNAASNDVGEVAEEYPEIQFCQTSLSTAEQTARPENYHTFNGEICQARYVSGIAAGMVFRDLLDRGEIQPEQALAGFVGAFPNTEVISSFTAFLLGIRSVAPEVRLKVRYTWQWGSYSREKQAAKDLISAGCLVIGQYTNTIGAAVACEEAASAHRVYHIGYHQNMIDIAPSASLLGIRINWSPYVLGAVEAVRTGKPIEKTVKGNLHGERDLSAGFEEDWVQILELNTLLATEGMKERLESAVEEFRKGSVEIFRGDYTGVDVNDPDDVIDLRNGYSEHQESSAPSFHYILQDCVTMLDKP